MTAIYLVRHATPDWNRVDIPYHTPPGPPLTPQGESEAAELGRFLHQAGVQRLFSSPLERCTRTAAIAAEVAGLPVEEASGLGEWQPGETDAQVRARFMPVWERWSGNSNGSGAGPVALVTHGGPIALMLADLGLDAKALAHYRRTFDRNNPLPPAGVWRAERPAPDSPWELRLVHMPEVYRKKDLFV